MMAEYSQKPRTRVSTNRGYGDYQGEKDTQLHTESNVCFLERDSKTSMLGHDEAYKMELRYKSTSGLKKNKREKPIEEERGYG